MRIVLYNFKKGKVLKKFGYNNLQNVLRDLKRENKEINKVFNEIKICLKNNKFVIQK